MKTTFTTATGDLQQLTLQIFKRPLQVLCLFAFLFFIAKQSKAQDELMGVTTNGGPEGKGTVFSIKTNNTGFSLVKAFADWGKGPLGNLIKGADGAFYGTTYQGPIGSVITPHFRGLQDWKHLSGASSLCGACTEACPVKIDIHHHLLQNRRNAVAEKKVWWEKIIWFGFRQLMKRPWAYKLAIRMAPLGQKLHPLVFGTPLDPVLSWTKTRDFPAAAPQSFHDWWQERKASSK